MLTILPWRCELWGCGQSQHCYPAPTSAFSYLNKRKRCPWHCAEFCTHFYWPWWSSDVSKSEQRINCRWWCFYTPNSCSVVEMTGLWQVFSLMLYPLFNFIRSRNQILTIGGHSISPHLWDSAECRLIPQPLHNLGCANWTEGNIGRNSSWGYQS